MYKIANSFLILGKQDSNKILEALTEHYGNDYLQSEVSTTPKEILDSFPWPEKDFKFYAECYDRLERSEKKKN